MDGGRHGPGRTHGPNTQAVQATLEAFGAEKPLALPVLQFLAVAGPQAIDALLIHAWGPERLLEARQALLDAVDLGILVRSGDGRGEYAFASPETESAILAKLSAAERTRLHLRVVEAMLKRDGGETPANLPGLASHLVGAVPAVSADRAAKACLDAGRVMMEAERPGEAERWFEQGLAIVDRSKTTLVVAELYAGLGRAQVESTSDMYAYQAAVRSLDAAIEKFRDLDLHDRALEVASTLIPAVPGRRVTTGFLERAAGLAEDHPETMATLATRLARAYVLEAGDSDAARARFDIADRAARKAGRKDLALRALAARALTSAYQLNLEAAQRYAEEALSAAPADPERLAEFDACEAMIVIGLMKGQPDRMDAYARRMAEAGARGRSSHHEALGHTVRGRTARAMGRFDEARSHLERAIALHPDWIMPVSVLAEIDYYTGEMGAYSTRLEQLLDLEPEPRHSMRSDPEIGHTPRVVWARSLLGLAMATGDERLLDRARLDVGAAPPVDAPAIQRLAALQPIALLAARDGDRQSIEQLDAQYRALCGDSPPWPHAGAAGRVAWYARDHRRGARIFEEAISFTARQGLSFASVELAESYLGLVLAGPSPRPTRRQIAIAGRAADLADRLGVVNGIHNIRAHPNLAARSTFARAGVGALTQRERQIIELISFGMKNREIGERLHLSAYTVDSHVRHILIKLDARTRAEAAQKYISSAQQEAATG